MEVLKLADDGFRAAQIYRHLQADAKFAGRVPVTRTVQRIVRKARLEDTSGPWSLASADPAEAAAVVPVVAALAVAGIAATVTRAEARLIVVIRAASPDLPPLWAWRVARKYLTRQQDSQPTASLDLLVALAPWRSDADWQRFLAVAQRLGWLRIKLHGPIEGALADALRMRAELSGLQMSTWLEVMIKGGDHDAT